MCSFVRSISYHAKFLCCITLNILDRASDATMNATHLILSSPPRSCRQLQISKVCPAASTSKNRSAHTITKSSNKTSIDNHVAHPLRTHDIITARPQRASALKNLCLHNRHLCAADWSTATSRTPSAGPKTGFPTQI